MLILCPEYTKKSHLSPVFLTDINSICFRDYKETFSSEEIVCLDLDEYERSLKGQNDATMDAAIGVADYNHNRVCSSRHLLVELRLRFKSTNGFDIGNMKSKVSHSRELLLPERTNPKVVFVYPQNLASIAEHYFKRLSNQDHDISLWDARSVSGLLNYVVDGSQLDYQPETDLESIKESLRRAFEESGISPTDKIIRYWMRQMEDFKLQYKLRECNAIANVVVAFMESILPSLSGWEHDYLSLLMDDVKPYMKGAN